MTDDLDLAKLDAGMSSSDEDVPALRQKDQVSGQEMKTNARNEQMHGAYEQVNAALELILRNKLEAHLLDCSLARFVSQSFRLLSLGQWNSSIVRTESRDAQAGRLLKSRVELAQDLPLWHSIMEA